jgi:ribosomal protein L30E
MNEQELVDTVKTAAEEDRIIPGVNETVEHLEDNELQLVVLASNCPDDLAAQVQEHAGDTPVHRSENHSERLGSLCREPFTISVLGITT